MHVLHRQVKPNMSFSVLRSVKKGLPRKVSKSRRGVRCRRLSNLVFDQMECLLGRARFALDVSRKYDPKHSCQIRYRSSPCLLPNSRLLLCVQRTQCAGKNTWHYQLPSSPIDSMMMRSVLLATAPISLIPRPLHRRWPATRACESCRTRVLSWPKMFMRSKGATVDLACQAAQLHIMVCGRSWPRRGDSLCYDRY